MHDTIRKGAFTLHILLVFSVFAAPAQARGVATTFASPAFSSCGIRLDCPPSSCSFDDFEIGEGCFGGCSVPGNVATCGGYVDAGASLEFERWRLTLTQDIFNTGGDIIVVTAGAFVEAERTSSDLLQLVGNIHVARNGFGLSLYGGVLEVSVFRYTGAPEDLEDVEVESVEQLVALGLIDLDDILVVETIPYPGTDFDHPLDFTVGVSGIPSEEIVVFASESGVILVPALSRAGLLALAVLMLGAATYTLRKRRRPVSGHTA